jgi:hypothetical protein
MPTVVILLQILAQYGPAAYKAAVELFHHPDPTKGDLLTLLDSIATEDYDAIIEARRAARGLGPTVVPPPPPATNPKGFPIDDYDRELDVHPNVGQLIDGDALYQLPNGKFYVTMHGVGIPNVPADGWQKIWP